MRAFNDKKYVRAIDSFSKLRRSSFSPATQTELKMAEAYYLMSSIGGHYRLQGIPGAAPDE